MLAEGEALPSLREIQEAYGVSMITARRSQAELLAAGFAVRVTGRGLFVRDSKRAPRIALAIIGFSDEAWRRNTDMFGQLVGGVASAAWQRMATVNVLTFNDASIATPQLHDSLQDERLDGLLLRTAGDITPDLVQLLRRRNVPFVSIKREARDFAIPFVRSDDERGAYLATRHLLSLGHSRIGLLVTSASTAQEFANGYATAHDEYMVPLDPSLKVTTPTALDADGERYGEALLRRPDRPTAIVASSDLLAVGLYRAAAHLSIDIPGQLALVGFDDQEIASHLQPPLTTVRISYYELGRRAAELLLLLIDGLATNTGVLSEVELVIRGSTAPADPSYTRALQQPTVLRPLSSANTP